MLIRRTTPTPSITLTPAWQYALMVGRPATVRLRGWYNFEQDAIRTSTGYDWTAAGDRLWAVHGAALTDEAREHEFVPYWHGKRKPHGDGFERWRTRFLALHAY
jgi:hypothetical protein